ncbi:MAG: phosphoesterase [Gemmatimonadetes bacterium]|nr:phosphoesterase [Gemmatimonadota bacterium]
MARTPKHLKDLYAVLSPSDRLLIIMKPDPDALSSAWALKRIVTGKVQSSAVAHVGEIQRLDNRAMVRILKIKSERLDKIDVSSYSKVAIVDAQPDHFDGVTIPDADIVIDHHPLLTPSSAAYSDIRPKLGATATIMTEYLVRGKIKIPTPLATALCFGIKTDTNGLTRSTSRRDVSAYAHLLPLANMRSLRQIEYERIARSDLELIGRAVPLIQVRKKFLFVFLEGPVQGDSLVILADTFIGVAGVQAVAVASTYRNRVIVVLRGKGSRTDVGRAARDSFGAIGSAGGHKSAARAEIKIGELPEAAGSGEDSEKLGAWIRRAIQTSLAPRRKAAS